MTSRATIAKAEVLEVIRAIEAGEVTPESEGWPYCADARFRALGWTFDVFVDCDEWDYLSRIEAPDGRALTFEQLADAGMTELEDYAPSARSLLRWLGLYGVRLRVHAVTHQLDLVLGESIRLTQGATVIGETPWDGDLDAHRLRRTLRAAFDPTAALLASLYEASRVALDAPGCVRCGKVGPHHFDGDVFSGEPMPTCRACGAFAGLLRYERVLMLLGQP